MIYSKPGTAFLLLAATLMLQGCESGGTGPVAPPVIPCEDPSLLRLPRFSVTRHKTPVRVKGSPAILPFTTWARGDSVKAFFGGKDAKFVFTLDKQMYLVTYLAGEPTVTRISHDDEGLGATQGSINSPLLSPDGKKIVFAGTSRGKPAFIQEALSGDAEGWRVPLDPKARVTADPHWHVEGGKTYVYFSTLAGPVGYAANCGQVSGSTYRMEVAGDTTLGPMETTGIPGAYRGGLSKDGKWVGTSYVSSAIFDRSRDTTIILAGGDQQCNPSMNPFPIGSKRSDYMLILAFGGEKKYNLITGETLGEEQHENLWIYNRDDKIVWQAKRPPDGNYWRWEKPEWSTHPDFATAIALREGGDGDLVVVRIGALADADEGELHQAAGYLKIAHGGFNSDSYTHLWVAE